MNKICFFLLFILGTVFAAPSSWNSQHIFLLKKDEWGKVLVHEKAKGEKGLYQFWFRWTLYDGHNITIQSRYREFPKQHNLKFHSSLDSFRQILLNNQRKHTQDNTYLLLNLDKFIKKEKAMKFLVFIKDVDGRLKMSYIDPTRKKGTKK